MDRRTFLKKAGLVVCGISSLVAVGETVRPRLYNGEASAGTEAAGQDYYVMFMHPQQECDLRVMVARDKYKHERWVERYNRWAHTQGKTPYQEFEGELGTI